MRLSKTDGGVGYAYLCDGVSPASPVLSDGQLSFTPGISQTLGTPNGSGGMSYASHFYAEDAVGNLRGMSDAGVQGFPDAYNWDAFGQLIGRAGGTSTPFGYGEASGSQADGDSGLRLLGHRYYDSRTGRFISQDPAGDGDNWYAYCDNNPVSAADPTGLMLEGGGPSPFESMAAGGAGLLEGNLSFLETNTETYLHTWRQTASWGRDSSGNPLLNANGSWEVDWHDVPGSDTWARLGGVTTGGFMLPSDSMHHMRQRTWQEILQAGLQSILVAGALGTGAVHPGPVTSNPTSKIPNVTPKRGKPDKTVVEEETDKGAGSKFSVRKWTIHALWAYKNGVDSII